MQRQLLSGKIHGAIVTQASVDYPGSITLDTALMKAADILPFEKVLVANLTNGARVETYAIEGAAGTGIIGLNGGAAKYGKIGDKLIIMSFGVFESTEIKHYQPKVIYVNEKNQVIQQASPVS